VTDLSNTPYEAEQLLHFREKIENYTSSGGNFIFGKTVDSWGETLPPSELAHIGTHISMMNIDNSSFAKDDVSRKVILNVSGDDSLFLWAANVLRAKRNQKILPATFLPGASYIDEADATFAMVRHSFNVSKFPHPNVTTIPFHKVMVGHFEPGVFKDKLVLIGPNYLANPLDRILTSFNKSEAITPVVNFSASVIEGLSQEKTLTLVPSGVTKIAVVFIAVFLSFLVANLRPTLGLLVTFGMMLGVLFISFLLFTIFSIWLPVSHLLIAIFIIYYIWIPSKAINEYKSRFHIEKEASIFKEVESMKQNFISLMSHDLKTPVARIVGMAESALNLNDLPTAARANISNIIQATRELNQFISSILDLTKIESQELILNRTSKDINPILEGVVSTLKYEAGAKNIQFQLDLNPLYPIDLDVTLITRVFSNLIENAIKYGGSDTIVTIRSWDDDSWVYVEIADNGVGMAPEHLKHIFEKFYRIKNEVGHGVKGTGLGLYLVKYFIELHDGKIEVQSRSNVGTTFLISLVNK